MELGIWSLGFMKGIDFRLKLLLGLALSSVIIIVIVMAWWFWATSVRFQFGDSSQWPEHITSANNMAFRYPPAMEVIVPEDELSNPVSIVKKGERGESVLIQVGTWRPGIQLEDLDAAAARYEQAVSRRRTVAREYFNADDHQGILLIQVEASGRKIFEVFVLDNPSGSGEPGFRELSLQLPGTASAVERTLYEKTFRNILSSLDFLVSSEPEPDGRPVGIPESWIKYDDATASFSLWYPWQWIVADTFKEEGILSVVFQPKAETENAVAFEQGSEVAFVVHAGPSNDPKTLDELDVNFAALFRSQATEGTLSEERFSFPNVGNGISLEATQKIGGKDVLSQLVLLVASDTDVQDENAKGRAYVFSAIFPDPQENAAVMEFVRLMTKSFRLPEE